jgi:hypothetical protein
MGTNGVEAIMAGKPGIRAERSKYKDNVAAAATGRSPLFP